MCGIVGDMSKRKAYPILIKDLKRLEYRGYDSAGVASISKSRQQSEPIALIRNGILENHAVLKEKLQAKGYLFKCKTDTEVQVQPVEYIQITNDIDLLTVVQSALQRPARCIGVCKVMNEEEFK